MFYVMHCTSSILSTLHTANHICFPILFHNIGANAPFQARGLYQPYQPASLVSLMVQG